MATYDMTYCQLRENISSRFSSNSEANSLETSDIIRCNDKIGASPYIMVMKRHLISNVF